MPKFCPDIVSKCDCISQNDIYIVAKIHFTLTFLVILRLIYICIFQL